MDRIFCKTIFLIIISLIILIPTIVSAESQISVDFSMKDPNGSIEQQSSVSGTQQLKMLKSSEAQQPDYTFWVDVPYWWENHAYWTDNGTGIPGVTNIMYESDDDVHWTEITSWVSGDDGRGKSEILNEHSPDFVYYRFDSYFGNSSSDTPGIVIPSNYYTIQFIQTVASFTASPTSGNAPLTVKFTDTSTGAPLSWWQWSFGDGSWGIISSQNPSHTYANPGDYTVSLTDGNPYLSRSSTNSSYIHVDPAPTTSPTPTPTLGSDHFTYSLTSAFPLGDNYQPYGTIELDNVEAALSKNPKWQKLFRIEGYGVNKEIMGSQGSGFTDATLEYHTGHGGIYIQNNPSTALGLPNETAYNECKEKYKNDAAYCIPDYRLYSPIYLTPSDVAGKWGNNNKWIIIGSCQILSDPTWSRALGTTHGILGFVTEEPSKPAENLPTAFFKHAMNDKETIANSWIDATKDTFGGYTLTDPQSGMKSPIRAAVIFSTYPQFEGDYLPGYGTDEPDAGSLENVFYWSWEC